MGKKFKVAKIMVVDHCRGNGENRSCPFCQAGHVIGSVFLKCTHPDIQDPGNHVYDKQIGDFCDSIKALEQILIPDWCPLEDE